MYGGGAAGPAGAAGKVAGPFLQASTAPGPESSRESEEMDPNLEAIVAFLFKYRPFVFQQGRLALGASAPEVILALAAAAALVPIVTSRRLAQRVSRWDRAALVGLRAAALLLLAGVFLRPVLVVATVVPQENFLAILVDDSRSMRVTDEDGGVARGDAVRDLLRPDGPLGAALAERFRLRYFAFHEETRRVDGPDGFTFGGSRTSVAPALDRVRNELEAVPLAGIVLVSDGADNGDVPLTDALLRLKAAGVPVYTVGAGRERLAADVALERIVVPSPVLRGARVVVDVPVSHRGYGGRTVPLQVESGGRILSTREVTIPWDGEMFSVPVEFPADEPGARRVRFHVPPQPGETVTGNNTRDVLVVVDDRRRKILYVEGEPRFEVKFVRRAVADDPQLQVVVFQRTADDRFLRLDVDDPEELAAGFPVTRRELFAYGGLVLGSVEASFFTADQLRMIADFVSRRGGGLLALGGRRALERGGYAGTALAAALPVVLEPSGDSVPFAELRVEPTPAGLGHPVGQIASDLETSAERWTGLPPLSAVNLVRDVKPGAALLLHGVADGGDRRVVLAAQRYGRGRVLAFPIQDSWLWQMHADIAPDDETHETFWRQALRWLVSAVPEQVTVRASEGRATVGRAVTLSAEVVDSAFLRLNGATVRATVTDPGGGTREVPLEWAVDRDGVYTATVTPPEVGLYTVRVTAARHAQDLGEAGGFFYAGEPVDEDFDPELRPALLRRIAEETGGRYYPASAAGPLAADVRFTESGTTVREELDLWDMPAVFFALVTLLALDWGYRKWRGLA